MSIVQRLSLCRSGLCSFIVEVAVVATSLSLPLPRVDSLPVLADRSEEWREKEREREREVMKGWAKSCPQLLKGYQKYLA